MRRVVALVALLVLVNGCTQEDDMDLQERAEARAVEARSHIDDLAARIGAEPPEVRQDKLTDCVPGQEDSGLDLVYTLRVAVDPGAADRLRGEIADHFESEGWQVKRDPDSGTVVSVRFQKDTFTIGAKVSEADGQATVGGSGGCVR